MSDTDLQLLMQYTRQKAEDAFAEIVRRHLDLVFSAAFRQVRSLQLAEEVAQSVFIDLARQADRLSPSTILTAWLYQVTRRTAIDVVRREARRQFREQIAIEITAMNATVDDWTHIEPFLDEAMDTLDDSDRAAVLLRYFENKSLREVGQALGASDEAARKRVSRAVERLREFFTKRGVTVGAGGLVVVISTNAVKAAPVGLAAAITTAVHGGISITAAATANIIKAIAMTTLQKTLITATVGAVTIGCLLNLYNNHLSKSLTSAFEPQSGSFPATEVETTPMLAPGPLEQSPAPDATIVRAQQELRAALHSPIQRRRFSQPKTLEALALFGTNREAAVPILLDAVLERKGHAPFDAIIALKELGPAAHKAVPKLLELMKSKEFKWNHGSFYDAIAATQPDSSLIPSLLDVMRTPEFEARGRLGDLIANLAAQNPNDAPIHRTALVALLGDNDDGVRLDAAYALAKFPGEKDLSVVPELLSALHLSVLNDKERYKPIFVKEANTLIDQEGQARGEDLLFNARRNIAMTALAQLGTGAQEFVPQLEELARSAPDQDVREKALETIGTIDPEKRAASPEIEQLLHDKEAGSALVNKVNAGEASFDDLIEGLKYRLSVNACAAEIAKMDKETASAALPALTEALRTMPDYDVGQAIKAIDPQALVDGLKTPKGAYEAAEALSELGPEGAFAIPSLYEAIETAPISSRYAINDAIEKIDPQGPKALFSLIDLQAANTALLKTAEERDLNVFLKIENVFTTQEKDKMGYYTRGDIGTIASAVRDIDSSLYQLFVGKLLEIQPSLAAALSPPR